MMMPKLANTNAMSREVLTRVGADVQGLKAWRAAVVQEATKSLRRSLIVR